MLPDLYTTAPTRRRWPVWLTAALLFAFLTVVAPRASAGDPPPSASALADLEAQQRAFQGVVAQAAPSVVGIRVQRRHAAALRGISPGRDSDAVEQYVTVNGSGTVLTEDGLILTNEHVVQGAAQIDVLLYDGQKVRAIVLASDPRSDLAILQVPRTGLRPATLCDWSTVARGQWAVVIGNPFGLGSDGQMSVSVGVIANLGRQLPGLGEVDDRFYSDMIQVTAPINPGNSGGPLFNLRGELIGVVTAMHARAAADEGVGFAIPMTPAKTRLIDTLAKGRPVQYGYIGVTVRPPERSEREALELTHGVVIQRVEPDGPAAQAGLQVGDILVAYERQPVNGPAQLAELAGQSPIGAVVHVDFIRDGQPASVQLTVIERDVNRVSWMRGGAINWRGMRLADLSAEVRQRMHVNETAQGIIVTDVDADSAAGRADMQIGDVIEALGGQPVQDTLEFLLRVRGVKGTLEVAVRNAGTRAIAP